MLMHDSKIIGIGLPCTGNGLLARALELLGFNILVEYSNLREIFNYDGAVNVYDPIAEIEKEYPNSLYILTVRGLEEWEEACRQVKRSDHQRLDWPKFWQLEEHEWYDMYAERVREAGIECDCTNVIALHLPDDGWPALCYHLDVPVPHMGFPKPGDQNHTTHQA